MAVGVDEDGVRALGVAIGLDGRLQRLAPRRRQTSPLARQAASASSRSRR
jgi:hypothetical protein